MSDKIVDLLESSKTFDSWEAVKLEIKKSILESIILDENTEEIYNKIKDKYSEPMDISKENIKDIINGFAVFKV